MRLPFSASSSIESTGREKKKETAAEKQELPPRHGAVLGSCGSGWAEAADLRVADQCPPAQEPHLPGQPLWHSPFLFVFPLRLLHRELLLCNCKMGMRFPISVFLMLRKTLRWMAVNGECSYSYVVTICAVIPYFVLTKLRSCRKSWVKLSLLFPFQESMYSLNGEKLLQMSLYKWKV